MKKEDIQKLFDKNEGKNFILHTSIAVGRGINGVDYETFYGCHHWDKDSKWDDSGIIEFEEDYLVLGNSINDDYYNSGEFTRIIPYSSIVMITFINESKWYGNSVE